MVELFSDIWCDGGLFMTEPICRNVADRGLSEISADLVWSDFSGAARRWILRQEMGSADCRGASSS